MAEADPYHLSSDIQPRPSIRSVECDRNPVNNATLVENTVEYTPPTYIEIVDSTQIPKYLTVIESNKPGASKKLHACDNNISSNEIFGTCAALPSDCDNFEETYDEIETQSVALPSSNMGEYEVVTTHENKKKTRYITAVSCLVAAGILTSSILAFSWVNSSGERKPRNKDLIASSETYNREYVETTESYFSTRKPANIHFLQKPGQKIDRNFQDNCNGVPLDVLYIFFIDKEQTFWWILGFQFDHSVVCVMKHDKKIIQKRFRKAVRFLVPEVQGFLEDLLKKENVVHSEGIIINLRHILNKNSGLYINTATQKIKHVTLDVDDCTRSSRFHSMKEGINFQEEGKIEIVNRSGKEFTVYGDNMRGLVLHKVSTKFTKVPGYPSICGEHALVLLPEKLTVRPYNAFHLQYPLKFNMPFPMSGSSRDFRDYARNEETTWLIIPLMDGKIGDKQLGVDDKKQ